MNTGNSVRDADPPECAGLAESNEIPGDEARPVVRARPTFQPVQDIQELIDKLAAVTKQLRHPGHS
jgi:hypothetical protein